MGGRLTQMDPNLVSSAGFQPAFDQAGDRLLSGAITLQHLPMGHGFAAAGPYRHLVAGMGVPVDGLVDRAFGVARRAPDKSDAVGATSYRSSKDKKSLIAMSGQVEKLQDYVNVLERRRRREDVQATS